MPRCSEGMQDLNDMLLFAEVVERGGFAAAGRALGMPKSRLSRRLARLEEQLGVQLLQRSTRRLSLTPAGELFLRHCVELRDSARAAYETVVQVQKEPRGTVRMTCPLSLAQGVVARLMPRFIARYPEVRVEMRVLNRPVDPIEEGVDVALRVRTAIEDSTTLVAKTFGASRGVLVASPAQLERQGPVREPADLSRLDTVAGSPGPATWQLVGPDGREHVHAHAPRYVADDLSTRLVAAIAGVGAAILPDFMCREAREAGDLVEVLPGWAPPPGIVHAVYPARRGLVPAVRVLLDFLAEHLLQGDVVRPER
jgi:DNA-binding transcriptional LysR family regulator